MYQIASKELNEEELERVDGGIISVIVNSNPVFFSSLFHNDDTWDKEAVCFSDFWCAFIYNQMR